MSDLDARFQQASEDVTKLSSKPDNATMLALYALYKQGTKGDASGKRPGMLDPVGRAKFDAWKSREGMSSDEAKQAYIDLVTELQG